MTYISDIVESFYISGASQYVANPAPYPLVVPGAWYEFLLTRQVLGWTAGNVIVVARWMDVDNNFIDLIGWGWDILSSVAAVDAAPVALALYAKAPVHASRLRIFFGIDAAGSGTAVTFTAVSVRRCPMRLIVVAEEASGTLVNYAHPVHVSVKYTPRYEVAR